MDVFSAMDALPVVVDGCHGGCIFGYCRWVVVDVPAAVDGQMGARKRGPSFIV